MGCGNAQQLELHMKNEIKLNFFFSRSQWAWALDEFIISFAFVLNGLLSQVRIHSLFLGGRC